MGVELLQLNASSIDEIDKNLTLTVLVFKLQLPSQVLEAWVWEEQWWSSKTLHAWDTNCLQSVVFQSTVPKLSCNWPFLRKLVVSSPFSHPPLIHTSQESSKALLECIHANQSQKILLFQWVLESLEPSLSTSCFAHEGCEEQPGFNNLSHFHLANWLLNYVRLNPLSCLILLYTAAQPAREQVWHVDLSDSRAQGILRRGTSGKGKPVLDAWDLTVLQLLK